MADGIIKLGDFKDIESKTLVEKQLYNTIKPKVGSWSARCELKKIQEPYKTWSCRSVVFPKAPDASGINLVEGITPDASGSLTYIEQTYTLKPKGFFSIYTDEDVTFGFDNIVGDLTDSLSSQVIGVRDELVGGKYLSGNNVYTVAAGLTREDFIKIRISLRKFTNRKDVKVHAILTPEDCAELRLKYNVGGQNLFADLPANEASVLDGVIARFEGVDIEEDDSTLLYGKDSAGKDIRYAVFYICDSKGRKPVALLSTDDTNGEFIVKGLGSSGTTDALNQRGSIGIKFKGVEAAITAEECIVRTVINPSTMSKVDSSFDYLNGDIKAFGNKVNRDNVSGKEISPNKLLKVVLDKSVVSIAKSETAKATITDAATGATVTATLTSLDTTKATVSGTTITPVKVGEVAVKVSATGYPSAVVGLTVKA